MAFTAYSTHQMLGMVNHFPKLSSFWLQFFPGQINFTSEYIDFEKLQGGRKLAPFVSPLVEGKPYKLRGQELRRFKPAYLKPKHPVDPDRLMVRRAGEAYQGTLSPQGRRDAIVMDILREQREMITNRWEMMAAEAIINGSVIVKGDDYPEQLVDFRRAAGNTVVESGTGLWSNDASDPYQDLEEYSIAAARASGYPITDFILGTAAWQALANHPKTEKKLDTNFRNGVQSRELDLGMATISDTGSVTALKGTVGAGVRIWVYSDVYENDQGVLTDVMDKNAVVGINPAGVQGVRAFGAIMDVDAGYAAQEIFSKNWSNPDPSVEYVMSQSAPLMIPQQPDATFKAIVTAA